MDMHNLSLDGLLGELTHVKIASEERDDGEKDKDESSEKGDKKDKPDFLKSKEDKDSKDEGDEDGKQEKQASAPGSVVSDLMQKAASFHQTYTKETNMSQNAALLAGEELANQLMEKLAYAGDQNTVNGVNDGVVPHKVIQDSAQVVAEDDAKIQGLPGAGGSINQIFDSIVADANGQGAASRDQVHTTGVSAVEGAPLKATPEQTPTAPGGTGGDEHEKAAAVMSLVEDGYSFDDAALMVKSAAEQIEADEDRMVKQAALNTLLDRGVSFDDAFLMVKEAGALVAGKGGLSAARDLIVRQKKGLSTAAKVGLGVGAAAAVGGAAGAATIGREKKAAMDMLVQHGVDFDDAYALVNAKAEELYGV